MIEGTGPGRGVPWWRSGRLLSHRTEHGLTECDPAVRPGRLIAKIEDKGAKRA